MSTLTKNLSIAATDLTYRGDIRDTPYTGSVVIRSISPDSEGKLILYWETGKLIGQFWSTPRTLDLLSDPTKLIYSADKTTVTQDPTPIQIKEGNYYVRFYDGSSAYYAHAAVRGCCGCHEPNDRVWKVISGSIQAIHDTEYRLPSYDDWVPMAYFLGVYGLEYADAKAKGRLSPTVDNSKLFSKLTALETIGMMAKGGSNIGDYGYLPITDLEFLDFSNVDFCATNSCKPEPQELGVTCIPDCDVVLNQCPPYTKKPPSKEGGCKTCG